MSNLRNYTLLPSESHFASNDDDIDDTDTMGSSSEDSAIAVGYPVDDSDGKSAVQLKTTIINRALEETGMGSYQWCMQVVVLSPSLRPLCSSFP